MKIRRPVVELLNPDSAEVLQSKSPGERLAVAFGMWDTARLMLAGTLRQQHPDWSEEQIQREVASRIPPETVDQAEGHADGIPPTNP